LKRFSNRKDTQLARALGFGRWPEFGVKNYKIKNVGSTGGPSQLTCVPAECGPPVWSMS